MIIEGLHLGNIVRGSSNIKHYYLRYDTTHSMLNLNHNKILDQMFKLGSEIILPSHFSDIQETKERLSSIISDLGDFLFNLLAENKDNFTIIFEDYFAVCFEVEEEHHLYDDPYIKLTIDSFAIKEEKNLEDVEVYLSKLKSLFEL